MTVYEECGREALVTFGPILLAMVIGDRMDSEAKPKNG